MKRYKQKVLDWLSAHEIGDTEAVIILILSVLVLFSPFLFFGKITMSGDSTYGSYTLAYFFGHFSGSSMNQFVFSGYPLSSGFQFGYFNPLYNIFFRLFDFLPAFNMLTFLNYTLAAVITYFFSRRIGLGVYPSMLSGGAYVFSQYSMTWIGLLSISNSVLLLPIVFYCMLELARLKRRYIFIFGLVLGIAFLGTHYQFILISLLGGGVFFLFESWQRWNNETPLKGNIKPFFYLVAGFLIAFIISLPAVLGMLGLFAQSTRLTNISFSSASYLDLMRFLIPSWKLPYISLDEFRAYIGLLPFLFLVIALYQVFRKKIVDKRARFFFWFFIVLLVMSMQYSPFLLIIKFIPFVKYFASQSRWMYLANFGAVILAGYGFEYVLKNFETFPWDRLSKFLKRIFIAAVLLFTLANIALLLFGKKMILLLQNYFDAHLYANTTHLPLSYYHGIIQVMAQNVYRNFSFSNPDIVLFIVFVLLLYFIVRFIRQKDGKVLFSNTAMLVVLLNLIIVSSLTLDLGDSRLLTSKSNIAEVIHAKEKSPYDYRAFSFSVLFAQYQMISALHPEAEAESLSLAKEALQANLNIFSQIPVVGGYDTLVFKRYQNIVEYLEDTTAEKTTDEKISLFLGELPLLSALNVKYIVSPYILESPDLTLIFSEKVTSFNVPLYLYENKQVLPRFYLAKSVVFLPENAEAENFSKIINAKTGFKDVTFIECNGCVAVKNGIGTSTAEIISESDEKIEINVNNDSDHWFVLTDEAVPGWKATIDGVSARIYYANHAFMGVEVPKGEHQVVFSYTFLPKINFSLLRSK